MSSYGGSGGSTTPLGFSGLVTVVSSDTEIEIYPGSAPDDTETSKIEVSSQTTVDISASGANGLDTGSVAASSLYYLYLIKNSSGTVSGLLVLQGNTPTMPSGYTIKRKIGTVLTDASSDLLRQITTSIGGKQRKTLYREESISTLEVVSGGTETSSTAFKIADFVPKESTKTLIQVSSAGGTTTIQEGLNEATPATNTSISSISISGSELHWVETEDPDILYYNVLIGTTPGGSDLGETGYIRSWWYQNNVGSPQNVRGTMPNIYIDLSDPLWAPTTPYFDFWNSEYDKDVYVTLNVIDGPNDPVELFHTQVGTTRSDPERTSKIETQAGTTVYSIPNTGNNSLNYKTTGTADISILGYIMEE